MESADRIAELERQLQAAGQEREEARERVAFAEALVGKPHGPYGDPVHQYLDELCIERFARIASLQQLTDERGREVERLKADFDKLGDWISPDIEAKRECIMSAGALNQMRRIYRSMRDILATPAATPPAQEQPDTACGYCRGTGTSTVESISFPRTDCIVCRGTGKTDAARTAPEATCTIPCSECCATPEAQR